MTGFPDISRHLARDQEIIQKSLARACALLPRPIFEEYRTSLGKMREQPELLNSSIRWFMHHYFLFSGFLQAIVFYDNQPVFTFGARIMPWDHEVERDFPPELYRESNGIAAVSAFSHLHRVEERGGHRMVLEGVVPSDIEPIAGSVLDIEVLPMARNYYFFDPGIQEKRLIDYMRGIEAECDVQCRKATNMAEVFSISHFRFQDMSIYFEMSGEKGGGELMQAISTVIQQNLKSSDILFQLSPFSYLALSPGADRAQIYERYQNIYFGYKSLFMDYDLEVVTLDDHPGDWSSVWEQLNV